MREIHRMKDVFSRVCDLDGEQREAALADLCGDDPALLEEVRRLLESEGRSGGLLDEPLFRAEAPRLSAGDRLGPLRIDRFVDRGGSGEVYVAFHDDCPQEALAIKILARDELLPSEQERFLEESRVAEGIHHPHLVELRGAGEDEERGILYYAMRFAEGPNLAEVLESWSRCGYRPDQEDRRQIVRVLTEVGEALEELHANGLIHRDVKPANIVLEGATLEDPWREGSRAVLVDLGLVRPVGKRLSTVRATPSYASPEQWRGEPLDGRTDVYSLGVTAHDLIAGRTPDRREGLPGTGPRELEPLSSLLSEVEEDLVRIVLTATEPRPRSRYASMKGFTSDLKGWLAGGRVTVRRFAVIRDLRRWMRRHPGKAARIGGLLAIGVLVLGLTASAVAATISGARELRSLWQEGDLPSFRSHLQQALPLPAGLLMSSELEARAEAVLEGDESDPVVEVLRVRDEQGELASFHRAAALLERDGLTRYPELLRYLRFEWMATGDRTRRTTLLARLFYERPNETDVEDELARILKPHVWRILRSPQDPRERHEALTILSGCGELEDLDELMAWILELCEDEGSRRTGLDVLESTLRASSAILKRAQRRGELKPWPLDRYEELLRNLAALHAICVAEDDPAMDLSFAFGPVFQRAALVERGRAKTILRSWLPELDVYHEARVLAALKDADLREDLLNGPRHDEALLRQPGERLAPRIAVLIEDYGLQIAMYEDPALEATGRQIALELGGYGELAPARSQELFEEGLAHGRRLLSGTDDGSRPDEGTHLGDELVKTWTEPAVDDRELEWPAPVEKQPFLAAWDFTGDRPRVAKGTVRWANARFFPDEASPDGAQHLRLLNPGVSEILLKVDSDTRYPCCLHIDAQSSRRWMLYESGIATFVTSLNGRELESTRIHPRSEYKVQLFPDGSEEWNLRIRLDPAGTTTARIHRIWIHRHHPDFPEPCRDWGE